MDLVVRTPHGDADLSVVSSPDTATLADLVEVATGQVAPPLVRIDDRPIDAATRLRDAPLLIGSVVSSHPAGEDTPTRNAVELLQLAGSGAGTVRTLDAGRYRVGPGRRLSAVELADAPVEHPMFEMLIERAAVTLIPISGTGLVLDGRPVSGPTPWSGEHLVAGTRVFTVEPSAPGANRRRSLDADSDGSVQFSRSPQLTIDDPMPLVVDAVRRAERSDPMLWQHRVDGGGGVVLPFGLVDEQATGQHLRQVSITLEHDRPAAVVGSDTFREALARTLLIEATTRYGPAELAIVLATRADRLARWDWVKWLPHLQTPGAIAVLSSDTELAAWATSVSGPEREDEPDDADRPSRMTLVVVDDAELWSRNDSPWRQLITHPVPNVVMLALADRIDVAPPTTRTVIAQDRDQRCRLTVAGRSQPLVDVLPALVEPELATRVARALAPLRDSELAPPTRVRAPDAPALTLTDALRTIASPDASRVATVDPADPLTVVLGTDSTGAPVSARWSAGGRWSVEGPDAADVATTALTAVLSIATNRSPEQIRFVLIAPTTTSVLFSVLCRLPHFAGRCDADDPTEFGRLLARLEQHLDEGGSAVVVAEPSATSQDGDVGHVTALCAMAAHRPGLRVLDMRIVRGGRASSPPPNDANTPAMSITIDRRARQLRGVATATDREGAVVEFAFDPFALRSTSASEDLIVHPFVHGRALTPLERQLERAATHVTMSPFGAEVDAVTDEIVMVHHELGGYALPLLVPPPLPSSVAFDQLLADHEADAVPIGVADDPVHGRHDVVWWQPGSAGSMLFIGSPRSGMDVVIETLPLGIAERYADADIHVHAIDSSNRRLSALQRIPHVRAAVSPDRLDQAAAIIDLIALEVAERRVAGATDRPALVLLIGDLTQLGRRLRDSSYAATLDSLRIVATAGDLGVNVIGTASRAADSCGLIDVIESVFVGSVSRLTDAGDPDVDGPGSSAAGPGRCRWSVTDQVVQLASPSSPTASPAPPTTGTEPTR